MLVLDLYQSLQKFPENKSRTVYISSRPKIIMAVRTNFPKSVKCAKLLTGPTDPMPGPMPAMHVATELVEVAASSPVKYISSEPIKNIRK